MDALAEKLDRRFRDWKPEIAARMRQNIEELIDLADQETLDVIRSRTVEQEVLDILDDVPAR